jgi:hypothetical protein
MSSERWLDLEFRRLPGSLILEQSTTGAQGSLQDNNLFFADPASVNSVVVPVTIESASVQAPEGQDARVQLRIIGLWFNNGTGSTGSEGDVGAVLTIAREMSMSAGLVARYAVFRCTAEDCSTQDILVSDLDFAPIQLGQTHELRLSWDGTQFTFGVDGSTQSFTPGGANAPAGPARAPSVRIHTRADRLDNAAERGHIRAVLGSVTVNGSLYDDFSAENIDPAKWLNHDFERGITDGRLHSRLAAHNGAVLSNNARIADPAGIRRVAADVTVLSASARGTSSEARARIGGLWYGTDVSGEGSLGDVFAAVELRWIEGALRARPLVVRCDAADCSTSTVVFVDNAAFPSDLQLGQTYPASIAWNGTSFTFSLGTESITHQPNGIGTPTRAASVPTRLIGTRSSSASPDGSAVIHATFDNVVVERN